MDRQYIHDYQVVERYLQGRLTAEEQQAFEEAYLGDPELIEQLELAERLHQGLEDVERAGELKSSPSSRWSTLFSSPQYAAAASVLLLVSLVFSGALYRENLFLQDARRLVTDAPITRLVPVFSVRGGSPNTMTPAGPQEWVVLLVDPGILEYQSFRASVIRQDQPSAQTVWQVSDVEPGYEDLLAVGVPGNVLVPGDYDVLIEGRMAEWPADRDFDQVTRVPLRVEPGP